MLFIVVPSKSIGISSLHIVIAVFGRLRIRRSPQNVGILSIVMGKCETREDIPH
jgi:hypothetical protein